MKYKRDEKLLREMYSGETLAIFKHHLSDDPWLRLVDSYINALPPTRLYGLKANNGVMICFTEFFGVAT